MLAYAGAKLRDGLLRFLGGRAEEETPHRGGRKQRGQNGRSVQRDNRRLPHGKSGTRLQQCLGSRKDSQVVVQRTDA